MESGAHAHLAQRGASGLHIDLTPQINKLIDKRLAKTHEAISAIRLLKLFCWEDASLRAIADVRQVELATHRRRIGLHAVVSAIVSSTPTLGIVVVFAAYSKIHGNIASAPTTFAGFTCAVAHLLRVS